MKKIVLVLVVLLAQMAMYSQNLVPNPGFEIITSCMVGNITLAPPWDNPSNGSPDLMNVCSPFTNSHIPYNSFGFQYARTGNGYVGAGFYESGSLIGYREYIQVKLDTPLIMQEHYCSSFYINRANRSMIGLKNIGMYFSDTHTYDTTMFNLNFNPQIKVTNYVTDDSLWTIVYGEYVAHGGERYIIIGNFYNDSLSDTVHVHGSHLGAYYYIDDVNVHCCTCDSTTSLHAGVAEIENGNEIILSPNPTSTTFTITSTEKIESVKLYNIIGELLVTESPNINQSTININQFSKGIYIVEVSSLSFSGRAGEGCIIRKKLIKE